MSLALRTFVLTPFVALAALAACGDDASPADAGPTDARAGDAAVVDARASDAAAEPTDLVVDVETATIAERVRPNERVRARFVLRNRSNADFPAGTLELAYEGDSGWTGTTLAAAGAVAQGGTVTLEAMLGAPPQPGRHHLAWRARFTTTSTTFGERIELWTEVTCSDGVFCNGTERWAGGSCMNGPAPCDDGESCTTDGCDEVAGLCAHQVNGACAVCREDCVPECTGRVCGDNGCGGSCGGCDANLELGCALGSGQCLPVGGRGTCANPIPLLTGPLLGRHRVHGDTSSTAVHQLVPTCNDTSEAVEHVYAFEVSGSVGIDARSLGYDTVLSLRKESTGSAGSECLDDSPAATIACSDDASPPGDYGSRVSALLDAGTYYLIVDGFDASQFGPYDLDVRFVASCEPRCDGVYCGGDDGCGGDCGTCDAGFSCVDDRCQPSSCTPDCTGKVCGDDGCGGSCGACQGPALCVPSSGQCQEFPECVHEKPSCAPACAADEFCGSDCACHRVSASLPDIVVDRTTLADQVLFDEITVDANSCSVAESCVSGSGVRRLLRFSVAAVNQGQATLSVPPPADRPDLFGYSPCHGHYHFGGFANYALLDRSGNTIVTGHKQAYCMEDTERVLDGPNIGCGKLYDCENQSIQAGWSDVYGNSLDCQWLDITGLAAGEYQLTVSLNPRRVFEEVTRDNNETTVPVTIP